MLQPDAALDDLSNAASEAARALPDLTGASTSLSDLPWGADALVITGMLIGLALWLAGRKLIRPLFALAAAGALGALGFFGPAAAGLNVSPHVGLAVGAVVGAVAGLLLYRLAMAASLGAALAIASPVLLAVFVVGSPASTSALSQDEMLLDGVPMQGQPPIATPADFDAHDATEPSAPAKVRAFVKEAYLEAEARWVALPLRSRLLLLGVAATGGASGFLIGLLIPRTVALLATALLGPLLWASCILALGKMHGVGVEALAPATAQGWLILWLGLSAVGAIVQWTAFPKRADKHA